MGYLAEFDRDARFEAVGRDLFVSGAVTSHGGNLSESDGERIWISRRGAMLGRMGKDDVIETGWEEGESDAHCSRELVVHRALYHATGAGAIVHAHTVHTIFRSMIEETIVPQDSEAKYVIGELIPVFSPKETIASPDAAQLLAGAMGEGAKVAVLRTHGPFAIGDSLEEAFYRISVLEASCKLLDLQDATGGLFL